MLHSRKLRISFAQLHIRVSAKHAGVHSIRCHYTINETNSTFCSMFFVEMQINARNFGI